jgi:benzoate-CoA ligase family protein
MLDVSEKFNISYFHVDKHVKDGMGKKAALRYDKQNLSYEELQSLVNRAGNFLLEQGVGMDDRVMIALPDRPEHIAFFVGAMKIGAVPFSVHYQSDSSMLGYYLNDSRAKAAILGRLSKAEYEKARPNLNFVNSMIVVESEGELPIRSASPELETADTRRDDTAYWVYTSGTTGKPRAAVHCHQDLAFCASTFGREVLKASSSDVFFSTSKLNFSYGRVNSMHMPLLLGATSVLDGGHPTPELVTEIIQRFEVTLLFSVPTLYNRIVNHYHDGEVEVGFPKLRLCIAAGEPLPQVVYQKWVQRFGVELVDGYGSSEAEYICISQLPGRVKPGSSGVLLPGWEAKIVDAEGKKIAEDDVEGNLWIKSPSTVVYYWHDREATRARCVGEWFNTGDMFKVDSEGYFHFVGRADDMFKSSGMWVSPSKVENALLHHNSIAEAAVIGMPDRSSGLVNATAFVVLRNGFKPSEDLIQEIRNSTKQLLRSYEVPGVISFVEQLPKTSSGKIQRYLLRATGMGKD